MNIILKSLVALACSTLMVGCKYNLNVSEPHSVEGKVIHLYEDLTLDTDYTGNKYVLHEGVTLDLNGHTLSGDVSTPDRFTYLQVLVQLEGSNTKVMNGTLEKSLWGINAKSHRLNHPEYLTELRAPDMNHTKASKAGTKHRKHSYTGQVVDKVFVRGTSKGGMYVQALSVDVQLINSRFDNIGTMAVYVDHGSIGTKILYNEFSDIGKNHITGREGIAVDACRNVTISHNHFHGGAKLGYINVYTNWGEEGVQREVSRGHTITDNTFVDNSRGITLASRMYRRAAGKTTVDYATDILVEGNNFTNVYLPIEDLGRGNTVRNNNVY